MVSWLGQLGIPSSLISADGLTFKGHRAQANLNNELLHCLCHLLPQTKVRAKVSPRMQHRLWESAPCTHRSCVCRIVSKNRPSLYQLWVLKFIFMGPDLDNPLQPVSPNGSLYKAVKGPPQIMVFAHACSTCVSVSHHFGDCVIDALVVCPYEKRPCKVKAILNSRDGGTKFSVEGSLQPARYPSLRNNAVRMVTHVGNTDTPRTKPQGCTSSFSATAINKQMHGIGVTSGNLKLCGSVWDGVQSTNKVNMMVGSGGPSPKSKTRGGNIQRCTDIIGNTGPNVCKLGANPMAVFNAVCCITPGTFLGGCICRVNQCIFSEECTI